MAGAEGFVSVGWVGWGVLIEDCSWLTPCPLPQPLHVNHLRSCLHQGTTDASPASPPSAADIYTDLGEFEKAADYYDKYM